jgi:HK97 family phage portal protein
LPNRLARAWNALVGSDRADLQPVAQRSIGTTMDGSWWEKVFNLQTGPVSITERSSLGLSAVYSCVRVLSEDVAAMPLNVHQRTDRGNAVAYTHPNQYLLHDQPHEWYTAFQFRATMMAQVLLWGNAYARISWNGIARPTSFKIYLAGTVDPYEHNGRIWYNTPDGVLAAEDIIHIPGLGFNGICGMSPIRTNAESLGVTLAAQRYGGNFFKNGANPSGALQHPKTLSAPAQTRMKENFREKYQGVDNAGEVLVLEEGMEYVRIGVPPEEAQFLETRGYGKTDICGIFRVPPHMIADLSRSTNNNIEHQGLEYVQYSLMPWLIRFEQEFNRKIFYASEKGRFFTKHNVNALLRGDLAARQSFYQAMIQNGVFSQNDVRAFEDMETFEGGDQRWVQQNMMPLDKAMEILTAKMAAKSAPKNNGNPGAGSKDAA